MAQPPEPQQPAQPQEAPQGPSPVESIISKTHEGLMQLSEVFEKAGQAISPQDSQKLAGIVSQFQALVEDLSGNGAQEEQAPQPIPGPMDPNAGPDSKPY
jgi:ferritin-like metal-binding protein YciE